MNVNVFQRYPTLTKKTKAYHDLEETLLMCGCCFICSPTKVTRLVAQQVAKGA